MDNLKLYIFHTGKVMVDQAIPLHERNPLAVTGLFRSKTKQMILPVSAYLIVHPKGNVLIDTGWDTKYAHERPKQLFGIVDRISAPIIGENEGIDSKLASVGLCPAEKSLDWLIQCKNDPDCMGVFVNHDPTIQEQEMEVNFIMEIFEIMQQRHSVRQYTDRVIEPEKRAVLDALTQELNQRAGLSIQIVYDDPTCFDSFMAHYGKFTGVRNYIALIGKKSPKLDEALGYCGEELVLKAQELGLNTCWVALTHGKSKAVIGSGEKQVCLIALGYGAVQGVAHKSKPMSELCTCTEPMPEWFLHGMNAAMLAPTAMNQQKFHFELLPDGTVKATCGSGFYTKLDLGIVKHHFEVISGKKTV